MFKVHKIQRFDLFALKGEIEMTSAHADFLVHEFFLHIVLGYQTFNH